MGSGITLKKTAAADIPTPGTDKSTLFREETTGDWSIKDETGTVESLAEAAGAYAPGGTDVAVADGGTGASTAAAARTNLGVDSAIATAIANLIASAPGALDTLNELAAALGNDASFAATITAALAGKQPLDSDLTAIAAIAPSNDDVIQRKAGAWTNRTMAQLAADLGVGGSSDLDSIIAVSSGQDIADALTGAAAPDAGNPFATMADVGVGGGSADHAAYIYQAAKLEPLAIEPLQFSNFSYVIGSGVTKLYQSGWSNRLGAAGRFDMREARDPIPLRGVTLTGLVSGFNGSTATFIDPALPTYADARQTYLDRLQKIAESQTHYISLVAGDASALWLPGPYGCIIVGISFHDTPWIGLYTPIGTSSGSLLTIHNEAGDASGDDFRISQRMYMPVSRLTVAGLKLGTAGGPDAVLAGVAYIICDENWGEVVDATSYIFRDDFMGASLDTATDWTRTVSTAGNIEINTEFAWVKAMGNNAWGTNGIISKTSIARATDKVFECWVYPISDSCNALVGWHDGAGVDYADMAHGIDFSNSGGAPALVVFENGNSRGIVGTYVPNCMYRVRVTLNPAGVANTAKYEIQGRGFAALGGAAWTNITPGTTSSSTTPVYPGMVINGNGISNAFYLGDVKAY